MLPEVALYFDRLQGRIESVRECLEEIGTDAEQLNWRPDTNCPSIFSLAAFIAMNTEYWIGYALGHLPEPHGFESVLEEAHGDDPDPLIHRLTGTRATVQKVLENIRAEDLDKPFTINDEPVTARQCMLQAIEDAAERYGEISTYKQWWGSE